jgi:hypothetical protein
MQPLRPQWRRRYYLVFGQAAKPVTTLDYFDDRFWSGSATVRAGALPIQSVLHTIMRFTCG